MPATLSFNRNWRVPFPVASNACRPDVFNNIIAVQHSNKLLLKEARSGSTFSCIYEI
jgi:hypothetical protein